MLTARGSTTSTYGVRPDATLPCHIQEFRGIHCSTIDLAADDNKKYPIHRQPNNHVKYSTIISSIEFRALQENMGNLTPLPDDASNSEGEHFPAPVIDHQKAKAQLLAVLHRKDPLIACKAGLDALTERNRQLLNTSGDAIREALAEQVAILEAVSTRFTLEALATRKADQQRAFASTALKANTVLTQALLALHRVTEDQRNGKAFNG